MSLESAKSYLEKMSKDDKFYKRHKKIVNRKERMKVIREDGYDFSADELDIALEQMIKDIKRKRTR